MKIGTIRQIAAEKLREIEPDIFEECENMVNAPISNIDLLPISMSEILLELEPTPDNSPLILAIVYYLYAPFKLTYQNIRCDNGIRGAVCRAMNWKDTPLVNYYGSILVSYYKNPRWAAKVKEMAEKIKKATLGYGEHKDGE